MRRALASSLLLLAACGSPPPPAPPVPVLVVPEAAPPPAPPEVASVEIGQQGLRALDAAGKELFRYTKKRFTRAVPVPGGGVAAGSYGELSVIGEHGEVRWSAKPAGDGRLVAGPGVVMFETEAEVFVFNLADGTPRGRIFAGEAFVAHEDGEHSFRLPLRVFAGALLPTPRRCLAAGSDGSILVGASDGSLLSLDAGGAPRFQTAVRGAVRAVEARPGGDFVAHTTHGDVEVGPLGVKAERPARARPTLAFQVGPGPLQDKVFRGVVPSSVVYVRPDDVWALVDRVGKAGVRHYDGKTWREVATPDLHDLDPRCWAALEDAAYARCARLPFGQDYVSASALARSADGRILLLGVERVPMRNAPAYVANEVRVWEHAGGVFRPHRELGKVFGKLHGELGGAPGRDPLHAAGPGGQEILCLNGACLARGLSPAFDPGPQQKLVPSGAPGWSFFVWNEGDWLQSVSLAFAGRTLWRAAGDALSRDGKVVQEPLVEGGRAVWASGEDDVWILATSNRGEDAEALHWDGKAFSRVPLPFAGADEIQGTGPDDVWVSDGRSAAHFDGRRFATIAGAYGRIVVLGREEAWIGGERVSLDPRARPDLTGTAPPLPPPAAPSRPLAVGPVDPSLRIERASVEGFAGALGIAEGPSGEIWIHDGTRVAAIDGAGARAIHAAPHDRPLRCGRCLAPGGDGGGFVLAPAGQGEVSLLPVISGRSQAPLFHAPALLAAARSSGGSTWIVGAAEEDAAPRALVQTGDGLRLVQGLPLAAYADVAPRADDDVWLAGGLSSFEDGTRAWPAGEGILVHFDGRAFTRLRAPDGALLSVAAVGPGEAWAVGQGGSVLHVRGETVETFHLVAADDKPLRHTLRAVAASGRDDVLIAGDAGTLLHWDGRALRRVDTRAAGPEAGFSALIAPSKRPGWLVGPGGVWRVSR